MKLKKCEECWANYRTEHKCDELIRALVQKYKQTKKYRHTNATFYKNNYKIL